uniref:Arc family DNA-binding protein n=1 Tax=Aeromonas dhakensis TaxID=196024 RepID=UPI00398C79B5
MQTKQLQLFSLRMEDELKELLKERARKNGRSLNQELIRMLKGALEHEGHLA